MKLKSDTRLRKKLFVEDAMAHPAKGHLGLWEAIIERYTEPGQWLLDPMAGVGSTLTAALMGRNVICNEMEQHFVTPLAASWEKMRRHPMLGYAMGQVVIVRGDARHLPLSSADAVITSPPYGDTVVSDLNDREQRSGPIGHNARQQEGRRAQQAGIPKGAGYTVDAVISSPPYANRLADTYVDDDPQRMSYEMGKAKIDAVVSSPPYENTQHATGQDPIVVAAKLGMSVNHSQLTIANEYGATKQNIGNQKGDAYWTSMKAVYQECHRVLRDGGIMALVLKGFTRDGKYIDLPQQTADLVESLGFTKFDEWTRELWSLSFWRILQKRRDPEAFDDRLNYEYVLAFRKDGGASIESLEQVISAVITSPPWEQSTAEQDKWKDSHAAEMAETFRRNHPHSKAPPGNVRDSNTSTAGEGYTRGEAQ